MKQHPPIVVPQTESAASILPRVRRAASALAALALASIAIVTGVGAGCSDSGPFCEGGFVRKGPENDGQGTCEGKCEQSKCLEGNACVDNRCTLTCTKQSEC